jgi:methylmalonyl-CoA mutase, C-terminal domain
MSQHPIRVLLAKVGLDLHDVGAKFVARSLRDAGMEVIYLGPFQTSASIVNATLEEGPDVVAISSISGEYKPYVREIVRDLKDQALDPLLVVGGLVPPGDKQELLDLGVDAVFGQGSAMDEIIAFLRQAAAERRAEPDAATAR